MEATARTYQSWEYVYMAASGRTVSINDHRQTDKRRRDRLMGDRQMRYAIDKNGMVHDRDCPRVKSIADSDFQMAAELPTELDICPVCKRRALIRCGLPFYMSQYIDVMEQIFIRLRSSCTDLQRLFAEQGGRIDGIDGDGICLRVNEDRWILRPVKNKCLLFHNNYHRLNKTERVLSDGFHLQFERTIPFAEAVNHMCGYTWAKHLEGERQRRLRELRFVLAGVRNYRHVPRFSLFSRDYIIADADDLMQKNISRKIVPYRVVERENCPDSPYCALRVRIPRRRTLEFLHFMDRIKEHCVQRDYSDYDDYCLQTVRDFNDYRP